MTLTQPLRSTAAFLAFAVHNAEEALTAPGWALAHIEFLEQYTRRGLVETWAGSRFRFSLLGLTLMLLVLAVVSARAPKRGAGVYLLLVVLGVFAANAVFPHIVGAVILKEYVPGVLTAVLVVLPAAAWINISMIRDEYATRRGSLIASAVGAMLYAAVVTLVVSP